MTLPEWAESPEALDQFAQTHVRYEVAMLTGQVRTLLSKRLVIDPATGLSEPDADALIEAALVHLRLLDEFLGRSERRHGADVLACDWPGSWRPERFLTGDLRNRVNKQLAHLASDREWGFQWPLEEMTTACCRALTAFIDAVEPERRSAFDQARRLADQWIQRGRLAGSHPSLAHSAATASTAPTVTILDTDVLRGAWTIRPFPRVTEHPDRD